MYVCIWDCLCCGALGVDRVDPPLEAPPCPPAHGQRKPKSAQKSMGARSVAESPEAAEELVFKGLRLLQQSGFASKAALAQPSLQQHFATPERKQHGGGSSSRQEAVHELDVALMELQSLRSRLEAIELAEARQAARVIVLANSAAEARAARRIEAGFRGLVARRWTAILRVERRNHAAIIIQAGMHGYYARAIARAHREAAAQQHAAARAIQAAELGRLARRAAREQALHASVTSIRI